MKKSNYEPPTIRIVVCNLQFMLMNPTQNGIEASRQNYTSQNEETWEDNNGWKNVW